MWYRHALTHFRALLHSVQLWVHPYSKLASHISKIKMRIKHCDMNTGWKKSHCTLYLVSYEVAHCFKFMIRSCQVQGCVTSVYVVGGSSVWGCVRGDSLIISSPEVQTSSLRQVMEDVTVKGDQPTSQPTPHTHWQHNTLEQWLTQLLPLQRSAVLTGHGCPLNSGQPHTHTVCAPRTGYQSKPDNNNKISFEKTPHVRNE